MVFVGKVKAYFLVGFTHRSCAKIVVFGVVGFAFGEYALLLAALCALVIVGTWTGSQLLERVDERTFTVLYKGVLTVIALRLVVSGVLS